MLKSHILVQQHQTLFLRNPYDMEFSIRYCTVIRYSIVLLLRYRRQVQQEDLREETEKKADSWGDGARGTRRAFSVGNHSSIPSSIAALGKQQKHTFPILMPGINPLVATPQLKCENSRKPLYSHDGVNFSLLLLQMGLYHLLVSYYLTVQLSKIDMVFVQIIKKVSASVLLTKSSEMARWRL